jgi:hypothetical protein
MGSNRQETVEQKAYKLFCTDYKLKPEWLGKTFRDRGVTYTITGLSIRSKRFPVLTDGGTRFNAEYVRGLITGDMDAIEKERQEKREQGYKQARKDYSSMGFAYGLDKPWLDKTFIDKHGQTWRIDGLRVSARRYPVQCRRVPGNEVSFFRTEYIIELMTPESKKKAA